MDYHKYIVAARRAAAMDGVKFENSYGGALQMKITDVKIEKFSALIASSAVSFSGLLGFVGLVTPHIALFISGGGRSRRAMLLCLLIGPLLVLLSDLLARTVASPGELPAGVFMAAIGVPFFIFLLIRRARS